VGFGLHWIWISLEWIWMDALWIDRWQDLEDMLETATASPMSTTVVVNRCGLALSGPVYFKEICWTPALWNWARPKTRVNLGTFFIIIQRKKKPTDDDKMEIIHALQMVIFPWSTKKFLRCLPILLFSAHWKQYYHFNDNFFMYDTI
jgi:hypothetical protein